MKYDPPKFAHGTETKDGKYRVMLARSVAEEGVDLCAWVLNNPSTANATQEDATTRRLWQFTRSWGYDCMMVVNTNPVRATNPDAAFIPEEGHLEINDSWLFAIMKTARIVVCGWGDKAHPELVLRAVNILQSYGQLHALRITKAGNPQHPLYLPKNLTPKPWSPQKWQH